MYHDLNKLFWWSGLKGDVTQFIYSCLTCQKSKVEHQKPDGLMTPLDVLEWKWDSISMDFVTSLPNTPRGNDDHLGDCGQIDEISSFYFD